MPIRIPAEIDLSAKSLTLSSLSGGATAFEPAADSAH